MKKLSLILAVAILLAGGASAAMSGPSYAQGYGGYDYPPPPQDIYATPWVGTNTPWVFYNGDWFLKGILYLFFGNQYGWAPYYSYPPVYIVRPNYWYAPRWNVWYQGNPQYWNNFVRQYPYWAGHHAGQRYDQNFYNRYHRGQGGGWHQGFHGVRPPLAAGPGVRPPRAPGPGVHGPGTTGPGFRPSGETGPGVRGSNLSRGGRGGQGGRSGNLIRGGHGGNLPRGGGGGRGGNLIRGGGGGHGGGGGGRGGGGQGGHHGR